MFEIVKEDKETRARLGRLNLPNGVVETPVFMPVATQGTVKTLTPMELIDNGVEMIVCNTYHLYLRPGVEVIRKAGSIQKFTAWHRPVLTDSGGYQVYSLATLREIQDNGVRFQSHIDGSYHLFTPEVVIDIQENLGSDIVMVLDVCPPYPVEYNLAREAKDRTRLWAQRSKKVKKESTILFGIIQGATYPDLRKESAREISDLDFAGYGLGGLCLGEPAPVTYEMISLMVQEIPKQKPCYLMGAGYPWDIIEGVKQGVDIFDCVLPTRNGRTGTAFTSEGRVHIRNTKYLEDSSPLDPNCECYCCLNFSRSYLRHLFIAGETLGPKLLTLHNIHFFIELIRKIREALKEERFLSFAKKFANNNETYREP